jgi:cold shock CspA family protein/ribosome-associated translation inhibitor RaiA
VITVRGIESTAELENDIRQRIEKLETYCSSIMSCRVLVEFGERHHERGNRFHVRIDLTVPGEEIAIAHDATRHDTARDEAAEKGRKREETDPERKHVHVAVREAFDVARRRLQDYARRRRGDVKNLTRQPHGMVARIFPIEEYGFIQAGDGHEVYFQKNSVLGDGFKKLAVGTEVAFVEEEGDQGPQASTVRLIRRRRRQEPAATPSAA